MLLNSRQLPLIRIFLGVPPALPCVKTHVQRAVQISWLLSWLVGAIPAQLLSTGELLRAEGLNSTSQPVSRIEAGLRIDDLQTGRWNRLILLSRPRIASGDVDALPEAVRHSVSEFVLTIMASVDQSEDPALGPSQFRLADIGVGYSTSVAGELKTVTVAEAAKVGIKLGLFDRMTLAENEKQLGKVHVTARTATLAIIDAPAFVLRGGEHHPYIMRHFVWVDPRTGRAAALVWLIDRDANDRPVVETDQPARWAAAGLREDRAIHVDGSQFNILGIPNERAFAIEKMPPGKSIAWSPEAQALAALERYDAASLRGLSASLNAMLQAAAQK
jgi:hypothetical protein